MLRAAATRLALSASLFAAIPAAAAAAPQDPVLPVPLQPVVSAAHRTCTAATPSGLGYSVLRSGTGANPAETDLSLLAYIGYLAADGQVFDQSPQAVLPVNGVIPGFSEGLRMMSKGGITRFCIPAALGYGAAGAGAIPANAALVFQVELLDFRTQAEVEAMRKAAATPEAGPPPAE